MNKLIVLSFIMLFAQLFIQPTSNSSESGQVLVTGFVPDVCTIDIDYQNYAQNSPLNLTVDHSLIDIADVTYSSNLLNGFDLNLISKFGGLCADCAGSSSSGNQIDYQVAFECPTTLGSFGSALVQDNGPAELASNITGTGLRVCDGTTNPVGALTDTSTISVTTAASSFAVSGRYHDVITISMTSP